MLPLADGLEDALASAGDGVFVTGADGRVVLWNRAAEKILGHSAREVMGRGCCDLFAGRDEHGNRLCYVGCAVRSLVKIGEPVQSFDMRTRTKAGRPVWLSITILSVGAGGERRLTAHLFRDVTATKELLTLVHERLGALRTGADTAPPAADTLTRRELEVLRLMAQGLNTAATAERLHVSRATVRNHVQNIFAKLEVHSRLEAVARATRERLL
jgi:PAS domain S-box-containing protein